MTIKKLKKITVCLLSLVMLITCITQYALHIGAEELNLSASEIYVDSTEDLIAIAKASRGIDGPIRNFEGQTIRLTDNITIDNDLVKSSGVKVLTIGKSGDPFKGVFDGNFYTITGLKNEKSILPDHNIGLFAEIENAVIKNLTMDKAFVDAAYEAGIVVGEAKSSTITNVIVKNSKLKVQPANNVVSLITNLGTNGGAIAGKANSSYFYNCESSNTLVYNNTTSGITGVGGERLDLGGIVGYATHGTIIEYCRVLGGKIRNDYDIAVGAVGGKELMTGGIVGEMSDGVKVIDCFSNAKVSFKAANYVAVGSGIAGYAGGIAGVVYGGDNEIIRSHFAGTMDSYQYNAILVIPIIQHDVNLSGIIERSALKSDITITDSFYRQDSLNTDNNSSVSITGFDDRLTIKNSRALNGTEYKDKDLWKKSDYDFFAEIDRTNVKNSSPHQNQWIMDYELNMPVHGHSLSATFDFPGAVDGEGVIVSKTYDTYKWNNGDDNNDNDFVEPETKTQTVSTKNPYQFAVMGFDTYQRVMTLETKTNEVVDGFSLGENPYKFMGWYKSQDKHKLDSIPESHEFFDKITSEEKNKVHDTQKYDLALNKTNNSEDNNDLYVAHYLAKVQFHNVDGTSFDVGNNGNYYNYMDKLPSIMPEKTPEGCTFYGWTTIPNENGEGYIGITSDELSHLQSENALYFAGDSIEKPMKLYPIYTNYISNIKVEVEGYNVEDSSNTNPTSRPNVANASVLLDEETNDLSIQLTGLNNGNLPDGYRFLGWYEDGKRVSQNMTYTLKDTDLTKEHTYVARFEYRVDYKVNDPHKGESEYATLWMKHGNHFKQIEGPEFNYEYVNHWGSDYAHDGENDCSNFYTSDTVIVKPLVTKSHIRNKGKDNKHDVTITTDFPGSGDITARWDRRIGHEDFTVVYETGINEGYNFQLWTVEDTRKDDYEAWKSLGVDGLSNVKIHAEDANSMLVLARVTAYITHHQIDGHVSTVQRRYQEKVLSDRDITYGYNYLTDANKINGSLLDITLSATPEPVKQKGYLFLGWIDKTSMTEDEFNYVYGGTVNPSTYATTDARKAIPYLIDSDTKVTGPMDLYPVYVKTNFTTTSNVKKSGVDGKGDINLPKDPGYDVASIQAGDGYADITFTVDNNETSVIKNDSSKGNYQFKYLEYTDHHGDKKKVMLDEGSNNAVTVKNLVLGPDYTFIAYYEPYVLTYHVSAEKNQYEVRNSNDFVGNQPKEELNLPKENIFIGWTLEKPEEMYWSNSQGHDLVDEKDTVKGSMELWPVFDQAKIKVESNIDDIYENDTDIRDWKKTDTGYKLWAQEKVNIGEKRYTFVEWQKKNPKGEFETFSKDSEAPIKEVLSDQTYKAIYDESYVINYHDLKGEIIYTANASKTQNQRSFIQEIDGKEAIIDIGAFENIQEQLTVNDMLIQWQWKNGDKLVDWNDFYNEMIKTDMDLYPVVYSFSSKDSEETDYQGVKYTRASDLQGKEDTELDVPATIYAYMTEIYTQSKLLIEAKEYSYIDGSMNVHPLVDKTINLQVADENMQTKEDYVDNPYSTYEEKNTDNNGQAIFEFTGKLEIQKNVEDNETSEEDIFIFKIKNEQGEILEVPVKGNESVILSLPCGKYSVEEDANWSWRYTLIDSNMGNVNEDGTINIVPYHKLNNKKVSFVNIKNNNKWFTDNDRKKNVFKGGGVS